MFLPERARLSTSGGNVVEQASDVRSRLELEFTELSRLAREHERGWNRLAAYIVGHCRGEI